jgi:hypothetical protein
MAEQRKYALVGFAHGLLALNQHGGKTYRYREEGEWLTLLRLMKVPDSVIEDFRAADGLAIVKDVVLTPEMLRWFDSPYI